jgi:hypothetical protein
MEIGDRVEVTYYNSDKYLRIYKGTITGITANNRFKVSDGHQVRIHSHWSINLESKKENNETPSRLHKTN